MARRVWSISVTFAVRAFLKWRGRDSGDWGADWLARSVVSAANCSGRVFG